MAGRTDVGRMLREMTPRQWIGWEAYCELEPFGAQRDNYHAGIIATVLMELHGARRKDGRKFEYEDFLLKFSEASSSSGPTQTWQQKLSIARMLAEAQAKAVSRKET